MKIIKRTIILFLFLNVFVVSTISTTIYVHAGEPISVKGMTDNQRFMVSTIVASITLDGEDFTAQKLINETIPSGKNLSKDDWKVVLEACVNGGYLTDYVDDFIALGISIGGTNTSASTTNETTQTASSKTEFTVADVEPYNAWATKDCNIRSGADTTYDKIGSLKQYEQVTVTGVASTGWYRITTSDGIEAYISNTLITTDDPSNREYTTVNDSGEILTYEFTDTDPEIIDQVVEQIEAEQEEEHVHEYTSEVTKEATCTEAGIITYTCKDGDDTYTEELPMLEHEAGEWVTVTEPTILNKGHRVQYCSVGGEILAEEDIPAKTGQLIAIIVGCAVVVCGVIVGVITFRKKH